MARPAFRVCVIFSFSLAAGARAVAVGPVEGAPITLQPCVAGLATQQLIVSHADSTIRSTDASLCVTYGGSFPSPLVMRTCDASPEQKMTVVTEDGSIRMEELPGGCLAWNAATDEGIVSSYTCSSIAWNGIYTVGYPLAGVISANYSDPGTLSPPGGLCATAAPLPPPRACPATTCGDDIDCNLNGVCDTSTGKCTCYKPWGGATCGELQFLPIAGPAVTNGMPGKTPNETTWGGNAILFEGIYHLFVAEMVNNCTLAQWGTNSRCAHATSPNPEGPYTRVDIAVDVWCHNPQVSYIPGGGYGGKDLWALWHIGSGEGGHPAVCDANGTVIHEAREASASAQGSSLHLANSPTGPWVPFDGPLPGCNNPTQLRLANGTWLLVCDSTELSVGPNVTGPFKWLLKIPTGGTPGIFEDGFLYQDKRGNLHNFFHTYTLTCDTPLCDPTSISGHSFSSDGLNWHKSCVQPYLNTANVLGGGVVQMSTRERPKLLFGGDGEPTHLFNGVCPTPHCPPQPAINCKVQGLASNVGYWDHTLVVPLAY